MAARKAAGLSQVELAEMLGKPQSYVSKVEAGDRRIDIVEYVRLAGHLGLEPEILLKELATDLEQSNFRRTTGGLWKK